MRNSVLEKWSEQQILVSRDVVAQSVDEFERVLSDAADERPLQVFMASHANILSPLAPPGSPASVPPAKSNVCRESWTA